MHWLINRKAWLLLACALAIAPTAGQTQDRFPSKALRIIVPVPPGGNLDAVTRAVAERLSANIGQAVVVENRTGASSTVGTRFVAQSPADGYTLLAMANTFVSTPAVMSSAGYDPVAEFAGVSLMVRVPNVVIVPANSPSQTMADLIAYAKAKPGEVSYATAGAGSVGHMAAERFSRHVGLQLLHVPYKGNGPALVDMVGGRVAMMFDQVSTSGPHIKGGRLRALGVTSLTRSPLFPEVPTLDEAGVKGFEDYTWNGLAVPAATPRDVLARLHADVVKALQSPELRNRFAAQGIEVLPSASYDEFTTFVRDEVARNAKLARDANIKVE
jgi:tripartite-type tricarboxylate transporter receptor subunit TctC